MAHAARRAAVGRGKDGKGTLCTRAAQPTHMHMLRCRGECECPDHTRVQPSQGVEASGIVPVPRARLCPHSTENDATANGPGTECPDLKESAGNGCWWRSAEADILCDVCRSVTSTGCLWALHHQNAANPSMAAVRRRRTTCAKASGGWRPFCVKRGIRLFVSFRTLNTYLRCP